MGSLIAGNAKSKTSWFGTALIVLGAINDNTDLLKAILPNNAHVGAVISAIGLAVIILRNLTNQSIAEKATTPPPPEK